MELPTNTRLRTLSQIGCIVWGLVALAVMLITVGLLIYVDQRFGAESSALFLGLMIGIPFLLLVALIVGGIYVLIVKGTAHLQAQDDSGEIERMRALRELARHDRLLQHPTGRQPRLPHPWQAHELLGTSWHQPQDDDDDKGGSYRILE